MSSPALQSSSLINSLMQPENYDPPVEKCVLIETHISWVILAGSYAYKIKKSLNLGFLDFSTLEKRHYFCKEELRLNKRLAPAIYLSVIPITGTELYPELAGDGCVIEYAVKMRAFPQQAQLDRVLDKGGLGVEQLDILARHIANFHRQIDVADRKSIFGDPETILQPINENFKQIRENVRNVSALGQLTVLEDWSLSAFQALQSVFVQRKLAGFVRECHGDMHLANIAWVDDAPLLFDCIEFNPSLRWIDVMSDVAFLMMDLQDRKQPELAQRFLNSYLQHTGDYAGIHVLRFYQVYRALVRAKIDAIRANQTGISDKDQVKAEKEFRDYLTLASEYVRFGSPQLIITRGMSASGKSTVSQSLLEKMAAIRIRSDVERKRLFGLKPEENGQDTAGAGLYSSENTKRTYRRLEELAEQIIDAGYSVIVDAVFLHYQERKRFKKLADTKHIPFIILECTVDEETLRQRIRYRKDDVSDADQEVLEMQLSQWQPLKNNESINAVTIDTGAPVDIVSLAVQIKKNVLR